MREFERVLPELKKSICLVLCAQGEFQMNKCSLKSIERGLNLVCYG